MLDQNEPLRRVRRRGPPRGVTTFSISPTSRSFQSHSPAEDGKARREDGQPACDIALKTSAATASTGETPANPSDQTQDLRDVDAGQHRREQAAPVTTIASLTQSRTDSVVIFRERSESEEWKKLPAPRPCPP